MLKIRLKNEDGEVVSNTNRLKLKAQDGKMRLRDDIEKSLGKSVISSENTLTYLYLDETKQIENP